MASVSLDYSTLSWDLTGRAEIIADTFRRAKAPMPPGPCIGNLRYDKNFIHFRGLHLKWALPAFFISGVMENGCNGDPGVATCGSAGRA